MNLQKMVEQAQRMQKKIKEFENKEFEYDYKNFVYLKFSGSFKIIDLKINSTIIDKDDPETLQDILLHAMNEAKNFLDNERTKLEVSFKTSPRGFF